ncbi:MAG TPA: secretin and TonB N-terminal domain-containing protein [Thermoanaerobaculia bacterium]|nr:secretin and TonB N-terminal domain-containing protein [Thermoanaerobaculia bacterium]
MIPLRLALACLLAASVMAGERLAAGQEAPPAAPRLEERAASPAGPPATPSAQTPSRWRVVATSRDTSPRIVVLTEPDRPFSPSETISLSVRNADLVEVVRSLAKISGLNLIVDPAVRGTVTAELHDVPWHRALAVILRTQGLGMEIDGRVVTVAPPARLYGAP